MSLLNAAGKRLLHTASQRFCLLLLSSPTYIINLSFILSDLLPDDFGNNTNKKRLRQFSSNILSLVGGDIATLLPRLPVLFRLVLRSQYLRDDIKSTFLQHEHPGILHFL